MQNYSNPKAGRMPSTNGINSKVSVPPGAEGKSLGNTSESPLAGGSPKGSPKGSVKGFSGGIINPKIGR